MSELDDLIQYWKDSLSINYLQRSPYSNRRILDTIKHLEALKTMSLRLAIQQPLLQAGITP